jgi:hypothetical protein
MTREQKLTFELIMIISLGILFYASTVSGSQPSTVARNSFEQLKAAEASGADITGLVAQYNSLLERSANDSAFNSLQSQTVAAQQAALASRAATNTLAIVLIPTIPFFLALLTAGILGVARKVKRAKELDLEIKET